MSGNDDSQQLLEIDTPHFQTMHIPIIKDKKTEYQGTDFSFPFQSKVKYLWAISNEYSHELPNSQVLKRVSLI